MQPIIMPQIGQDIKMGEIVQWCKKEGEPVEKGEVVVIVESEKATFEIEADLSGTLLKVLHQEGDQVEILTPIGYIGTPGERFDETQVGATTHLTSQSEPEQTSLTRERPAPSPRADGGRVLASPAVRRLARERGVDLSSVKGTGPAGRITKEDVLRMSEKG